MARQQSQIRAFGLEPHIRGRPPGEPGEVTVFAFTRDDSGWVFCLDHAELLRSGSRACPVAAHHDDLHAVVQGTASPGRITGARRWEVAAPPGARPEGYRARLRA